MILFMSVFFSGTTYTIASAKDEWNLEKWNCFELKIYDKRDLSILLMVYPYITSL